jgi:hypothetical protein
MEEDLEFFERSSTEDETTHATRQGLEAVAQSPSSDLHKDLGGNRLNAENDWDINEAGRRTMDGIETNGSIRTPTITTTPPRGTDKASIEVSIDTGQAISLPESQNPMSLEYLASPISSSFSLHSYAFCDALSSQRPELRNPNGVVSVEGVNEATISTTTKHYLFKIFLERTSPWVSPHR